MKESAPRAALYLFSFWKDQHSTRLGLLQSLQRRASKLADSYDMAAAVYFLNFLVISCWPAVTQSTADLENGKNPIVVHCCTMSSSLPAH